MINMRHRMAARGTEKSKTNSFRKRSVVSKKTRRSSAASAVNAIKQNAVKKSKKKEADKKERRSLKVADEEETKLEERRDVKEKGPVTPRRGRKAQSTSRTRSKTTSASRERRSSTGKVERASSVAASDTTMSGDAPAKRPRGRSAKSESAEEKKVESVERPKRNSSSSRAEKSTPAKQQKKKETPRVESEKPNRRRVSRKTKEQATSELLAERKSLNEPQQSKEESDEQPRSSKKRRAPSGDTNRDSKKVRPSQLPEDPYDFEAYAWGNEVAPKGRKPSRQDALKKAQSRRKERKAMAHMFFIQPSRKKKEKSAEREEPSPSIADEIAEIVVQPPAVDDEVIIGPRLSACRDRFEAAAQVAKASTPRLTAAPVVRPPILADALSPIHSPDESGATVLESGRPTDVRPLVESSRANSQENLEMLPHSPARSEDKGRTSFEGKHGASSSSPKRTRKKPSDEREKDEFDTWLSKFNQELSDIEAFQLSIDDSR